MQPAAGVVRGKDMGVVNIFDDHFSAYLAQARAAVLPLIQQMDAIVQGLLGLAPAGSQTEETEEDVDVEVV